MENKVIFSEQQRFTQWWLWFILLGVNSLFVYALIQQFWFSEPLGDEPLSDKGLLIISGVSFFITLLFLNFRIDTQIDHEGIRVRFFPFHLAFKHYEWNKISRCYIRPYSAIWEFGGWGLRYGFSGKGKAYTVKGNMGLQLELSKGTKLLIGTQEAAELSKLIEKNLKQEEDGIRFSGE
jgi:hypothetical protein